MADPKKQLQEFIAQMREKRAVSKHSDGIINQLSDKLVETLLPVFEGLSKAVTDEVGGAIKDAVKDIKVDVPESKEPVVHITIPEIKVPELPKFEIPRPHVEVKIPDINVPPPVMPDFMRVNGEVIIGNTTKDPIPVRWVDVKGNDVQFSFGGGSGGGKADFFTIVDIKSSTSSIIDQTENAMRVTGSVSINSFNNSTQSIDSSGNPYSQANPLPVTVVSGSSATTGSAIVDSSGAQYSGSNPVPVTLISGTISSTKAQIGNTDGDYSGSNPLPSYLASQPTTFDVKQLSGTIDSVSVTGFSTSIAASLVDSSGSQYSGSNPLPVTFTGSSSTSVSMVNADGTYYNSANPLPIAVYDAQGSTTTSHQHRGVPDYRGSDNTIIGFLNVESALNSSTATLGVGGEFTGLAEDVSHYAAIQIMVFTDVVSSTNGFQVQQSSDASNWDVVDSFTVPAMTAGQGKTYSFQPAARYFRIFYANGAGSQTAFRMYTTHHHVQPKSSSQKPSDAYSNENDFEQVWSFMSAFNGSTWDRLSVASGESSTSLRVNVATDNIASVNVVGQNITMDVRQVSGNIDSVSIASQPTTFDVKQVSGSIDSVSVTGFSTSIAASMIDSSGVQYSGSNPLPITIISGALTSTKSQIGNSDGDFSNANPLPITMVSGALSTNTTVYTRQSNPTAVAADYVPIAGDDLGRVLIRPMQIRDLTKTAYATSTTGAETTIIAAGGAGVFLDCIKLGFTNASTAAVTIDIRDVTAGNKIDTVIIPASTGPLGWSIGIPYPQGNANNNWTYQVSGSDISNTTVYCSGVFSQEV